MATQIRPGIADQIVYYLNYPFASCLPSSSTSGQGAAAIHERQGLLSDNNYDDSDAISLLSNIADRSRRRSRSARRREAWNKRAATLGCGLFGRSKGQIQRREVTSGDGVRSRHIRNDSRDSATSRETDSDDDGEHTQSLIESLGVAQESGDEDAGLLIDEDIAEISQSREGEEGQLSVPTVHVSEPDQDDGDEHVKKKEEDERAAIKATLDKEAAETARAEAEDAVRLAEEEAALAAEEEAAIAKAKRREERRAMKQGLVQVRAESQRERRRTEAEAEAAAGGFDFAEEGAQHDPPAYEYDEGGDEQWNGPVRNTSHYMQGGPEAYEYNEHQYYQHADSLPPQGQQQEVVHHHHYYHEPQPEEDSYDDRLLSPNFRIAEFPPAEPREKQDVVVEEDEDDADIAGITFSKKKRNRSREGGGSNTYSHSNGSGSGSRQSGSGQRQVRYEAHRKNSDRSAEDFTGEGSSNASANPSYRDRPRRHERAGSKSTGSGAGSKMREGVPSRSIVASPTIPESDHQADAAAGGFDDFVPPAEYAAEPRQSAGYRSQERRGSNIDSGSASSSGQRRERRKREGPSRAGGLNSPRNPGGANVFVQSREGASYF